MEGTKVSSRGASVEERKVDLCYGNPIVLFFEMFKYTY